MVACHSREHLFSTARLHEPLRVSGRIYCDDGIRAGRRRRREGFPKAALVIEELNPACARKLRGPISTQPVGEPRSPSSSRDSPAHRWPRSRGRCRARAAKIAALYSRAAHGYGWLARLLPLLRPGIRSHSSSGTGILLPSEPHKRSPLYGAVPQGPLRRAAIRLGSLSKSKAFAKQYAAA